MNIVSLVNLLKLYIGIRAYNYVEKHFLYSFVIISRVRYIVVFDVIANFRKFDEIF